MILIVVATLTMGSFSHVKNCNGDFIICGIVGVATKCSNGFTQKEADVFTELLFYDQLRGFDSTGVFGVDKHSNVLINKEASTATDFLGTKEFKEFRRDLIRDGMFAVGHNRAATRGNVVDKNAHPFWIEDKIVLVQNGTWRGCHKGIKDTEVDTEALAHIIAEEPDLPKALGKIQAAYALVWFNTETHTLNLIRNSERPLWLAESMTGSLVWASEAVFINAACDRQGVVLKSDPVQIEAYTHVELTIKGNSWERVDTKVTPTFPKVTQFPHDNFPSHYGRNHVLPLNRGQRDASDSAVDILLPEIICARKPEYHYTRGDALGAVEEINKICGNNKKQLFEMIDYEPANKSANCQTWHVYGTFVTPEQNAANKAICHFFVYNKSEMEVMEMVTTPWWEGYVSAVRSNVFNDRIAVVTAFISNPKPYPVAQDYALQ